MGGIYYMVEQVRVNPEEVRGYGNICEEHTLEDFIVSSSGLAKEKENVHGTLTDVYKLVYSLYGFMFDFDVGNKQLYLQMGEADILSFGFDESSKQLYLLDEAGTGLSLGFDEDTNELYITDAPPIVHNYSLAFSSSSYAATDGSAEVSVTLLDDGVAVTGATISFTGGTSTVTGVTNSSGVATATVSVSATSTITATYQNVTDTCTVTVSSSLFEDDCTSSSGLTNYGTPLMMKGSGGSVELTYDSGNNCYKVNPTSNSAGETMCIPITPMNNKDNYKLTFKIKHGSTVAQNQPSLFVYDNTLSAPTFYGIRYMGNGTMTCHTFNQSTDNGTNSVSYSTGIGSKWFTITLQREGTSLTLKVDDENGVNRYNKTHTASGNINAVGFGVYVYDRTRYYYIKDIVAEAL